jgi:hypothetical protein
VSYETLGAAGPETRFGIRPWVAAYIVVLGAIATPAWLAMHNARALRELHSPSGTPAGAHAAPNDADAVSQRAWRALVTDNVLRALISVVGLCLLVADRFWSYAAVSRHEVRIRHWWGWTRRVPLADVREVVLGRRWSGPGGSAAVRLRLRSGRVTHIPWGLERAESFREAVRAAGRGG